MSRYKQKSDFEAAELDGEWIILNSEQFTITKVNQVGGYCWELLMEEQTAESLTKAIMKDFSGDMAENEVKRDIEAFINKLLQYELLIVC